jgi:hypothetical protein
MIYDFRWVCHPKYDTTPRLYSVTYSETVTSVETTCVTAVPHRKKRQRRFVTCTCGVRQWERVTVPGEVVL